MNGSVISCTIRGRNPASTQARSAGLLQPRPHRRRRRDEPVVGQVDEVDGGLARQPVVDGQRDAERLPRDEPRADHRRGVERERDEREVSAPRSTCATPSRVITRPTSLSVTSG